MGLLEFELRVLDPRSAPEMASYFTPLTTLDCNPHDGLFVGDEPGTVAARASFDEAADQAHGTPLGTWVLEDVWVSGSRGFVIDLARRVIWHGQVIGWAMGQVKLDVEQQLGGQVVDDRIALLDEELFTKPKSQLLPDRAVAHTAPWKRDPFADQPPRRYEDLRMLAMPGVAIYGHWLLDLVPRLAALSQNPGGGPVYAPGTRPWANQLAGYFGVDLPTPPLAWPGSLVHTDRLELRTLLSYGRVMDRAHASAAWEQLKERILAEPLEDDISGIGTRLYVSRAQWSGGRTLVNGPEVEKAVTGRGFTVIHPETLSLRAQVEVFSRAERVLGEDGSGLHNSMFSAPGLHLTVLNVDRTNNYHASIANARGQRISYLASEPVDGGHVVPVERVLSHLDQHP